MTGSTSHQITDSTSERRSVKRMSVWRRKRGRNKIASEEDRSLQDDDEDLTIARKSVRKSEVDRKSSVVEGEVEQLIELMASVGYVHVKRSGLIYLSHIPPCRTHEISQC
jgi:hypothetical protein